MLLLDRAATSAPIARPVAVLLPQSRFKPQTPALHFIVTCPLSATTARLLPCTSVYLPLLRHPLAPRRLLT